MKLNFIIFLLLGVFLMNGCVSYDSLLNYKTSDAIPYSPQEITNFKPLLIQSADILHVKFTGTNAVALQPFTSEQSGIAGGVNNPQSLLLDGYLVDSKGNVEFPTLGKVKLAGLSLEAAKEKLENLLKPYFEEVPLVNIRLLNFRINITGEVKRPGVITIDNQSINLVEALTMAGDLTDYSQRDSILIIREVEGQRNFAYVNLNSAATFTSPYFYLQQNDVVYVRPLKRKRAVVRDPATSIFTWISAFTGIAAFIISLSSRL